MEGMTCFSMLSKGGKLMIEVTDLTKIYTEAKAVDSVSFTVEDDKVYGLLGHNGAGKSTIMNIMTGYISATSGTVKIDGIDIFEPPEEAKKLIGYLPEQPPVYLDMTPVEYLRFAAELKGIKRSQIKSRIEYALEATGLTPMRGRLIKNLSKGYRQRTGLAQAIIADPKVVILDEPTVGLDPLQIIEIRDLIKELGKNRTVILSSHIMQEISAVCDRLLILANGHLIANDEPANLMRLMYGQNSLSLTAKGTRKAIMEALSGIKEITKTDFLRSEAANTSKLLIECEPEKDIREKIFYKMAEAKLPILEFSGMNMTLEDIFIELTKNNQ